MTNRDDEYNQKEEGPKSGKELKDYVLNSLSDNNDVPDESEKNSNDSDNDKDGSKNKKKKRIESSKDYRNRKKENNMVRKIVLIISSVLVVTLLIAGFCFYNFFQSSLKPLDPNDDKLVQVHIPIGSSSKEIGQILENSKVIKSGLVFSYYVKTKNLSDFQAGYYQMSPDMTLEKISKSLQAGGTDEPEALADAKLTIPEGYTIEQIADLFDKETDVTKKEFLALMTDETFFNELAEKYPDLLTSTKDAKDVRYRLEGYLYPATYNYYKENELKDIVEQMVAKSNQVMTPYYDSIKEKKLTVQEVLSLASLVEKEGVSDEDRRNIAQVFFNRINDGMPLQSDISVLYAMNETKTNLSNKDTEIDSPYNLYVNKGFGPGPFNNPSEAAISAVMNPADNDYIYFLADVSTGEVYFAKTYEEHLALKEKYIDNQN